MKKYLAIIPAIFLSYISIAQSITGTWSGYLNVQGMKLPLVLHIQQSCDSLISTMDSPTQGAKGIPVNKTIFADNELQFEIEIIGAAYKGKLESDSISGTFKQMGMEIPLILNRGALDIKPEVRPQMPQPPFAYNIEEVNFKNPVDTNTLAGTLTTPKGKKQFPVVVMITGSGAQDRDETLFDHKPFWVIADHFTKNGIGVLRLDDRGVGGSSNGKNDPTSANFATDIDAAVNFLAKRGYKNIGLVGHSEGGMIAPMVSAKNKNVKFIVSLAGPGIAIEKLMVLQNEAVSKSGGATAQKVQEAAEEADSLYRFINNYNGQHFEGALKNYLLQHDDSKLTDGIKEMMINQQVTVLSSNWFRYFIKFDPTKYLTKLKIPVLALNGSKDIQVLSKQNLAGWKASLEKAGNKNFKTIELEDLNHLFQQAKTGSLSEYAEIEQTIDPKVLDLMTSWILKLK